MHATPPTHTHSLFKYYLNGTTPPFSWASYQTGISQVNAVLADATTPLPDGFAALNDFQTMHNFTRAAVQQNQAAWDDVEWTPPTTLQTLVARLAATDPYTAAVNDAEAENVNVRADLAQIDVHLVFVQQEVGAMDAAQAQLTQLQAGVNGTLLTLLEEVEQVEALLDAEENNVRELAAYVGTAPEYAKCGFVGVFYKEGFQGAFCGDLHGSTSVAWPFMLGAAFCLFVSFLAFSCFVRKPQWYLEEGYEDGLERNALTPGHTPHGGVYVVA